MFYNVIIFSMSVVIRSELDLAASGLGEIPDVTEFRI